MKKIEGELRWGGVYNDKAGWKIYPHGVETGEKPIEIVKRCLRILNLTRR